MLSQSPARRFDIRRLVVMGLLVTLFAVTTTAPARTQPPGGVVSLYLVAPLKATDDWSAFISKLDEIQEQMPDVEFRKSDKTFLDQHGCDGNANCDLVTIEKSNERHYGFKIKNGIKSHAQRFSCSICEPNTPPEQCPGGAQTDFAGFILHHNQDCHVGQASCNESACQ